MYSKICIKLYLVIFVINLALWSLWQGAERAGWFALCNLVALFVVLIQERRAFDDTSHMSQRVLFSADVFGFVAIAVGLLGATWQAGYSDLFVGESKWLVAVFIAALFYVLSVWVFRMYSHKRIGHVPHIRIITRVLAAIFVYLMSSRVLPTTALQQGWDDIDQWWSSLTSSLMTIAVPEEGAIIKEDASSVQEEIRERNDDADDDIIVPEEDGTDIEVTTDDEEVILEENRGDDTAPLTFGTFLPLLVEEYNLSPPTAPYTFTYVSSDDPLYTSFATARAYNMIGSATRPEQVIQCRHLMVLLGLAQQWDLEYTSANVFDVYWQYAASLGYQDAGCTDPLAVATMADLP